MTMPLTAASRTCIDCQSPIGRGSTRCRPCAQAYVNSDPEIAAKRKAARDAFNGPRKRKPRHCSDCAVIISKASTGRCRTCRNKILNSDPERRARAAATFKRNYAADPVRKERHPAKIREAMAKAAAADPAFIETRRENGRRYGAANIRLTWGPESRARAAKTLSKRKLAHIPSEYRELYLSLTAKDYTAAEREAMIRDLVKADQLRAARLLRETQAEAERRHARQVAEAY